MESKHLSEDEVQARLDKLQLLEDIYQHSGGSRFGNSSSFWFYSLVSNLVLDQKADLAPRSEVVQNLMAVPDLWRRVLPHLDFEGYEKRKWEKLGYLGTAHDQAAREAKLVKAES